MKKIFSILAALLLIPSVFIIHSCKKDNATLPINGITDIDGNVYKTVTIGTQVWMAENLKATKYRNGDLIGTTTPTTLNIYGENTPKYQWAYHGNETNVATYGRLYTWWVITDNRNLCPLGWHVPSDVEWTTHINYLGGENIAGGKLRETGMTHWANANTGATNESGFTALPGGHRDGSGEIGGIGSYGIWWSATEISVNYAWIRNVNQGYIVGRNNGSKYNGHSVRCISD
jgi:uncharacterized protein (TIGR02145 family)